MQHINALQTELIVKLTSLIQDGNLILIEDVNVYFDKIWNDYPFMGSKIRWSKVPHSIERTADGKSPLISMRSFFNEMMNKTGLEDKDRLLILGDCILDIGLNITVNALEIYFDDIIELPQHTYIIPEDIKWCICFSMEGYMSFGLNPTLRKI